MHVVGSIKGEPAILRAGALRQKRGIVYHGPLCGRIVQGVLDLPRAARRRVEKDKRPDVRGLEQTIAVRNVGSDIGSGLAGGGSVFCAVASLLENRSAASAKQPIPAAPRDLDLIFALLLPTPRAINARGEQRAKRACSNARFAGRACSQILGPQPGPLRDPGKHSGPDLVVVVKGEHKVVPACAGQRSVGTGLTLDHPANPQEGRQHPSRTGARPSAHAALKEILNSSGPASPCSSRSAMTRRASA